MSRQDRARLDKLEETLRPPEFHITRIELVNAVTGEVGGVLHIKRDDKPESRRDQ